MGTSTLLHHVARDLRDLHADALSRHRRGNAAVFAIYGSGVPNEVTASAPLHDLCGDHYDRGAVYFCYQSVLEHVQGAEGERQSVGVDYAGMDYGYTSAA